jgi:hypothetical protein
VPFSIFGISKKPPFGPSFHANFDKNRDFFLPERSLNRPFLNIVSLVFFFGFGPICPAFRLPFGCFGFTFGFLFDPFWFMLVHLASF